MKKKIYPILFIAICMLGCGQTTSAPISEPESLPEPTTNPIELQEVKELEDAEITIPVGIIGNEITEENATIVEENENSDSETPAENGNTAEADTSKVTLAISGENRTDIVNGISEDIITGIDKILNDDDYYPNIKEITPNENCTEFTITLYGADMNMYENMLLMSFYTMGDKYQLYYGIAPEDVKTVVRFVNGTTGEIIAEGDSTSMSTEN